MNNTDAELRELLQALPLKPGTRVWCDTEGMTHGRLRSIDAEGFAVVTLIGGCGDVRVPIEDVRRVCGQCADCMHLAHRPACIVRKRAR